MVIFPPTTSAAQLQPRSSHLVTLISWSWLNCDMNINNMKMDCQFIDLHTQVKINNPFQRLPLHRLNYIDGRISSILTGVWSLD